MYETSAKSSFIQIIGLQAFIRSKARHGGKILISTISLVVMISGVSGCNSGTVPVENPPESFIKLCKDFQYIHPKWRQASLKIRGEISKNLINPYLDLRFISGAHNEGVYERYISKNPELSSVKIQNIDVLEGSSFRLQIKMPSYPLAGQWFSLLAPKGRLVDCAEVQGKSLFQYI